MHQSFGSVEPFRENYFSIAILTFGSNGPKKLSEKIKENLENVVATVDKLNGQLNDFVEMFGRAGLMTEGDLGCKQSDQQCSHAVEVQDHGCDFETREEEFAITAGWDLIYLRRVIVRMPHVHDPHASGSTTW